MAIADQKTIPEGWQKLHLGDVADITNGKTNSQDAVADGEYPLFDRSVSIKKSNKFLFDGEAIILPGEGAEFIPRYFNGKFDLHQRAYAIFAREEKLYSAYLLVSVEIVFFVISSVADGSVDSTKFGLINRFLHSRTSRLGV
ncbi:MAG: restriction endonuclease subunit S [bacterium]